MKTVLFVLDYYLPHRGGVENVFENIILRLQKKGYKIIILTSKYNNKLKKYEKNENIEIYRTGKNRINFMRKAIKLGKKILNNKNHNIDVIHASTYGGAIPASILGQKFDKKIILTVHEIFGDLWYKYKGYIGGFVYKLFENIIFKFIYDRYHCVSHNTANDLQKYYDINSDKISVIHNGVDTNFWDYNKVSDKEISKLKKKYNLDDKFIFLYFGHAGKSKGIDYLIQALPDILKLDNIKFIFNLIESKRTRIILKKLDKIKNNNINNKYKLEIFNGFTKTELRTLISCCDCVIAPSISEGFGSVHTEAVAMGKILITTDTSAIPEVVWGNVKFIKPENSKSIVKAAKGVINGNYKKIPNKIFNWDSSVLKIEKLY